MFPGEYRTSPESTGLWSGNEFKTCLPPTLNLDFRELHLSEGHDEETGSIESGIGKR